MVPPTTTAVFFAAKDEEETSHNYRNFIPRETRGLTAPVPHVVAGDPAARRLGRNDV